MSYAKDLTLKYSFILTIIVVAFASGLIGARITRPAASTESIPNLNSVAQACVTIRTRTRSGSNQTFERLGVGLAAANGDKVITNAHIVKDANEILIKTSDGREISAEVIKSDTDKDMALLKVRDLNAKLPQFAGSFDLKVGQKVYALGKPFINSNNFTLTSGIISALPIDLPKGSPTLMQTDAVINPGNSGGPLIDNNGRVIGITTAYLS